MQPSLHIFSWLNNLTLQWASEFHRSLACRVLQHGTTTLDEPMGQSGSAIHTYAIFLYRLFTKERMLQVTINQESHVHRVK
jgi:hypothetical protein